MYYDRSNFCKKVTHFKRITKKRAKISKNEVTHDEYVEYFTNLFSHSDRPSSPNHLLIEKKVFEYFESIKSNSLKIEFNKLHIQESLKNLKTNKAASFDGLSNKFFKFENCDILVEILKVLFDSMATMGYIPNNFNIAILIPIPKKGKVKTASESMPISISTVLASIFESILLLNMPCLTELNQKQFGCKRNTSCKSAYILL